jgi:hypothetical protein
VPARRPSAEQPDPADPHQFAIYSAEDGALPGGGRQFARLADLRAWAEQVVADPWWSETFPSAPIDVDVEARSGTSTASVSHVGDAGRAAFVKVHPRHRHAVGVVHELAHLKEREHNKPFYALCEHMLPGYHQVEFDTRLWLTWQQLQAAATR